MSGRRRVVDAHLHFFDHVQNRHEFLEVEDKMFRALVGDYSSLPRKYSFADYVEDAPDVDIEGLVWHEFLSTDPVKEVLWAQQLAQTLPVPVALVGLVDFLSPDLEKTMEIYARCPNVAGVREHLGWDEGNPLRRFAKRPDLLTDPAWLRGLDILNRYRFRCSLEVFAPQLDQLLGVVRRYPGIRFAIAVMGWPLDTDAPGFSCWRRSLEALSACPNSAIVISAIECIFGMDWSIARVQPWVDTIFELFGTGRVMLGSHRPICGLSSSCPDISPAHAALTAGLSEREQDAVFRKNAAAWYFTGVHGNIP
jgi:predicted TIM-barrel fold metal-dependent hydrolase